MGPPRQLLLTTTALLSLVAGAAAQTQTAVEQWARRYSFAANDAEDSGYAIAHDREGNVIVAGHTQTGATGSDMLIIKYSGSGIPLWTNQCDRQSQDDAAEAVAVDESGTVYVAGGAQDAQGNYDFATIAFSAAGTALWTNYYNGAANSNDAVSAITVANGKVFVTGRSMGSTAQYDYDYVTIAYSLAGEGLWTNRYDGPSNSTDTPQAIAVDTNGNVFVTGGSIEGDVYAYDFATIAYTSSGVGLWTNRYKGPGTTDQANALAVDRRGNVYVAGYSTLGYYDDMVTLAYSPAGEAMWTNRFHGGCGNCDDQARALAVDNNGDVVVAGTGQDDFVTIKYTSAGVGMWTNHFHGGYYSDAAGVLAVDASNNVFVSGISYGPSSDFDYATVAYSSTGVGLWTNRYSGSGNDYDYVTAMTVDDSGSVYVTGCSVGSGSGYDIATIKYSGTGSWLWVNRYAGTANRDDVANAITVDSGNKVYVTGYSFSTVTSNDYATLQYDSAGVPVRTNRFNGDGSRDDTAMAIAVDCSNNVFVTGTSWAGSNPQTDYATLNYATNGTSWYRRYGQTTYSYDQANCIWVDKSNHVYVAGNAGVIKYSNSGSELWTRQYDGTVAASAADQTGNFYLTGSSSFGRLYAAYWTVAYTAGGVALWTNRYSSSLSSSQGATAVALDTNLGIVCVTGGSADAFASIAYSTAGVALWTNRFSVSAHDSATAVAADGNGNFYVSGRCFLPGSGADIATIKYSSSGAALWTNFYDGPANSTDEPVAALADSRGIVCVTGKSVGIGTDSDIVTIAYSSSGGLLWANRYNGPASGADLPTTRQSLALGPDGSVYVTGGSDGDYSSGRYNDYVTIKYAVSPWIADQPVSRTNAAGTPAGFSVSAQGSTPLSYQWLRNGEPIANATDRTLAFSQVTLDDEGVYSIRVSNVAGSITSSPAKLTVILPPPRIVVLQPAVPGAGTNTLVFAGIPGQDYTAEFATNLTTSPWFELTTHTAGADGLWTVSDGTATNQQRYYRARGR